MFGQNKKRERKSKQRDERKCAKTSKAPRKEHEDEESALSHETVETLQSQGEKLTGALEAMVKKPNAATAVNEPVYEHFHAGNAVER